ncbi:ACP S-malonyltransferase [Xenorhabdus budapestensis]|uniref:Malonyl CoA-acyl carrier protein transacylase n=1 Tax=Xenorhabdus budapestensis TaxID=290110 RepID=A0A2D0J165_XENBU|nr:acyltransferase domain-containing protein [Xenorhabdus budapestensis]PHM28000.1 type I modular polyketide synthase, MlsA2 [Xenorhabdus budapestensis]QTL38546.1 acyltransferase domain-containing protein [Xenorhabdus budapestensis]
MKTCTVAMFPGQGAQFQGMGRNLFDKYEYHMRLTQQVLGYSLVQVCEGETRVLNRTEFTQPALFVINILYYLESLEKHGTNIEIFVGHSLGEYCALFAAGAFSFETALAIVQERGRCMALCSEGAMAAVIGLKLEQVESLLADSKLRDLTIANFNSPTQFIISGDKSELSQFKEKVLNAKGIYHPLQVNGAFHSKRMANIAEEFKGFLERIDIFPLKASVLSNVTADFYPLNNREQLIDLLVKQLSYPVRWQQCIEKLHADKHIIGFEYGPKPVVGPLAKKILGERITLME